MKRWLTSDKKISVTLAEMTDEVAVSAWIRFRKSGAFGAASEVPGKMNPYQQARRRTRRK